MKNLTLGKNIAITVMVIIVAIITWFAFGANESNQNYIDTNTNEIHKIDNETKIDEAMHLVVYLQDKNEAMKSDCAIAYPKNIQVPKTTAVADASLTYLFENELSQYGNYESVIVKDGVAKVIISTNNMLSDLKFSSLSSCEVGHLTAVIEDTLFQYESISSIEFYSQSGRIEL